MNDKQLRRGTLDGRVAAPKTARLWLKVQASCGRKDPRKPSPERRRRAWRSLGVSPDGAPKGRCGRVWGQRPGQRAVFGAWKSQISFAGQLIASGKRQLFHERIIISSRQSHIRRGKYVKIYLQVVYGETGSS